MDKFFETASFHIVKPCNMKCKFCYATFNDFAVGSQLSSYDAEYIINKLHKAGLQKITFAGGEPLLYKNLINVIRYSKALGLTTSIISNGSFITKEWIDQVKENLDWIGISVDSLNPATNIKIGRINKINPDYYQLVHLIKEAGIKLKINTVVNKFNYAEKMQDFINYADPDRWKIFDTLKVEGQNDAQFEAIKSPSYGLHAFESAHYHKNMVIENNEAMTGSYLLIDPLGRLFENSAGKHTYSRSLIENNIEDCLSDINLNREMFIKRGGIYEW